MQAGILGGLDELADYQRPEVWYDIFGVGLADWYETPSASTTSSFRRAARRLHELGRLEIAHAWDSRVPTDLAARYRRTDDFGDPLHEVTAGARMHLVVRYPPSTEDLLAAVKVHQRHSDTWHRGKLDMLWEDWYVKQYTQSGGIYLNVPELVRAGLVVHGILGSSRPVPGLGYEGWIPPEDDDVDFKMY